MIVEMRYLVLVYLAVVAVTADQSEGEKQKCVPGTRYKEDCNDCICANDGKSGICTMMMCLQQDTPILRTRRQTDEVTETEGEKKICEPGARYKEDCNDCICANDGKTRVCTMMLCPPQDTPILRARRQTDEVNETEGEKKICEPGALYKEDCNDCQCSNDGKSRICTMMMCPPQDTSILRTRRQTADQSEQIPNNGLLRQRHLVSHNRKCEPGETFKIECNTCSCGPDGFSVACTKMGCPEGVYNEDGTFKIGEQIPNNSLPRQRRQISHNRECVPGKTFKIDCNSCTCGPDGFSVACTRMACRKGVYNEDGSLKNPQQVPNNSLLRQRRQVSHNRKCVPGETFKIYCNTCTCGPDGFSVICTRKGCDPNVYNEDGSLKIAEPVANSPSLRQRRQVSHNKECVPGETFKKYCNTCTCGPDGFSVICTRKGCDPNVYNEDGSLKIAEPVANSPSLRQRRQVSHNKECVPGETFKKYCNTCTCGPDGFSVICTRKGCDPNVYNEDGSLKIAQPVPNSPSLRQRRQVSHNKECVPGETFKKYCNTCTCGPDGFSVICTRKGCDPNVYNEDGSLKIAEPVANSPSLRQRRQVSHNKECVPGETFKNYCNTCTCGPDGFSVICTRKGCDPNVYNEDGSLKIAQPVTNSPSLRQRRQVSHNKECVPGETFKKYCNTCTCGPDGFSVICTRKGCDPNVYNEDGSLKIAEPVANSPSLRQRRQVSHNKECVPGETFKNYCNTCTCGPDGFSVICTRKGCNPNVYNEDGSLKIAEPVTNSPSLRQRRQVSHNKECVPGETFKKYCNTCTCGPDGFSVICTRKGCDPNVYNEDGSLKIAQPVPNDPVLRQRRAL